MEVVCSSPLDAPEIVLFIGIFTISSNMLVKYQRGVVEKRRVFKGIKE